MLVPAASDEILRNPFPSPSPSNILSTGCIFFAIWYVKKKGGTTMKLYELVGYDRGHGFSPFVWRAKMALAHKGIKYEIVPLHFSEIAETLSFADSKTVPVLVDGETIVSDSWDICCYLESEYSSGPAIFQSVPAAKLFNYQMGMPLLAPLFKTIVADIFEIIHDDDKEYFRSTREPRLGCTIEEAESDHQASLAIFKSNLLPYDQYFKIEDFLGGNEPTYQDFALYGMFLWARAVSSKNILDGSEQVSNWISRMDQLYDGIGGAVKRIEK